MSNVATPNSLVVEILKGDELKSYEVLNVFLKKGANL